MNDHCITARVRIAPLCVLVLGAFVASSAAACPVASDLETGIALRDSEGTGSRFRQIGEDLFLETSTEPADAYVFWTNGLGILSQEVYFDADGQEENRYIATYTGENGPFPAAQPEATWSGLETWSDPKTGEIQTEYQYAFSIGQPEPLAIGACAYTALPIDITVLDLGAQTVFLHQHIHIIELGMAYFVASDGGNGAAGDPPFVPVSIAVDTGPWPVAE